MDNEPIIENETANSQQNEENRHEDESNTLIENDNGNGVWQIKKIIAAVVMAVVLVITFVSFGKTTDVRVGRGNGISANVGTMEEFSKALSDFMDNFDNGGLSFNSADGSANTVAYSTTDYSVDELNESAKYKSATMYITDASYVNYSYTKDSVSVRYNFDLQKEMSLYITDGAVYYISEGVLNSSAKVSSSDDTDSNSTNLIFNCEFYMTSDIMMMKFNKLNIIKDGIVHYFPESIRSVWIDFSDVDENALNIEVISIFRDVNEANFSYLSLLSKYIDKYNSTVFTKSGSLYILNENYIDAYIKDALNIYGTGGLSTDYTGEFSVDLSDNTYPKVNINYSNKTNPLSSVNGKYTMNEVSEYGFTDFNNTVITPPSEFSAIKSSEFIDLMEDF